MQYTKFVTHATEVIGNEKCDAYAALDIATFESAFEGQKLADHSFILRVMGHLLGKVLTTVEATTPNASQAKAIKDLMRGHFSAEMEFVGDMLLDQAALNQIAEETVADLPDEEIVAVSIDEVLGLED